MVDCVEGLHQHCSCTASTTPPLSTIAQTFSRRRQLAVSVE